MGCWTTRLHRCKLSIFATLSFGNVFSNVFPRVLHPLGFCQLGFVEQMFQRHHLQLVLYLYLLITRTQCLYGSYRTYHKSPIPLRGSFFRAVAIGRVLTLCHFSRCQFDHLPPLHSFHPSWTLQERRSLLPSLSFPAWLTSHQSDTNLGLNCFSNQRCGHSTCCHFVAKTFFFASTTFYFPSNRGHIWHALDVQLTESAMMCFLPLEPKHSRHHTGNRLCNYTKNKRVRVSQFVCPRLSNVPVDSLPAASVS